MEKAIHATGVLREERIKLDLMGKTTIVTRCCQMIIERSDRFARTAATIPTLF